MIKMALTIALILSNFGYIGDDAIDFEVKNTTADVVIYVVSNDDSFSNDSITNITDNSNDVTNSTRNSNLLSRLEVDKRDSFYGQDMGYHPEFSWANASGYFFGNALTNWSVSLSLNSKIFSVGFSFSKSASSGWYYGGCDNTRQNRPKIKADGTYVVYKRIWYPAARPDVVDHVDYIASVEFTNKWVTCGYR